MEPEAKRPRTSDGPRSRRAFLGRCVDAPRLGEVRGLGGGVGLVVVGPDGLVETAVRAPGPEMDAKLEELSSAGTQVVELGEREFLVPGFVDVHIHLPQLPYAGTGVDRPLMAPDGFLAKYAFPTETAMKDRSWAEKVYPAGLDLLLRHGTTTALVYGSAHREASQVMVDTAIRLGGPRCFVGKVSMDRHCPEGYVETTEGSLRETEEFIKYVQAKNPDTPPGRPPLVLPVVTPRFLPTCTPELLAGLGGLARKYRCMCQSHLSESCDEVAFSASLFPGRTDAEVFGGAGLLRGPSVMGHCVHLMPGEEELMKENGAAIAHCPLSNFFFAKEALPVKQLVRRGAKVGLATDVAGGYSPSMLNAIRTAVLASKTLQFQRVAGEAFGGQPDARTEEELRELHDLSHFDALYLATQGGADALGLGGALGTFDVGKAFDAVVLTAEPTVLQFPGGAAEAPEDVLQKILLLGDDRNVREVFVGGRSVRRSGPQGGP